MTLEMRAGNVFNLQDFEQNKIKSKQRSFEYFIGTFFVRLMLIWMNNFQLCFHFHLSSCPGLACHANNFVKGSVVVLVEVAMVLPCMLLSIAF